jgi:cell division protein FtsN
MARTKRKTRKSNTARKSSSHNGKLWFVFILFVILIAAVLYYLADYTDFDAIKRDLAETIESPRQAADDEETAKPRFEFYQLLPDMTVPSGQKPASEQATPPPSRTQTVEYLLQVASFRNAAEADSLKAELTLLGFDVTVSTVQQQNTTWHRVRLGPFTSRPQAEDVRKALRKHDFDSLLQTRKSSTAKN